VSNSVAHAHHPGSQRSDASRPKNQGSGGAPPVSSKNSRTWENLTQVTDKGRCGGASFPERHKYLDLYPADFCHAKQPNLAALATVTPMQHDPLEHRLLA
jgi:hypothetical protein